MALQTVVFRFEGGVNEKSVGKLIGQIMVLLGGSDEDRDSFDPVLIISSDGGSLEQAMRCYSFLRQLPQRLTTIAFGQVASAATYVYLAGTKRLAAPEAMFMFHAGTYSVKDVPPSEMMRVARECTAKQRLLTDVISRETGVSLSLARRWLRESVAFPAEEAKKQGIVHEIVTAPFLRGHNVVFPHPEQGD